MRKFIVCLISLALIGSAAAALSTGSPTTASFNTTPVKVLDGSGSNTTETAWGAYDKSTIAFGPGADNTTLYLYGVKITSGVLSTVIVRKLNATVAGSGATDSTLGSVLGADTTGTASMVVSGATVRGTVAVGVGAGYYALASSQTKSDNSVDYLQLYVISSSAAVTPKTIQTTTSTNCVAATSSAASTGTCNSYAVNNVWFEDNVVWVLYEVQTWSQASGPGAYTVSTTNVNLQGYNITASAVIYTTAPVALFSSALTFTAVTPGVPATGAMGASQNYTMSTNVLVVVKDTATTVKGLAVTKSTGAVANTYALTTDATPTGFTYAPAGIISSNGTMGAGAYGFVVQNLTGSTYGAVAYLNGTTTASQLNLAVASATTGGVMAAGWRMGTGFGVVASYISATGVRTYLAETYYANTTVNTTGVTIGQFSTGAPVSAFADANGALWFGYVIYDSSTGPQTASIGKLSAQINTPMVSNGTTTSGNILVTMTALISFVIVSLFMF